MPTMATLQAADGGKTLSAFEWCNRTSPYAQYTETEFGMVNKYVYNTQQMYAYL
jgi:hypothetical protein